MSFVLAAAVFAKCMTREAWRYLTIERHLTEATIQQWGLGYSPPWPVLGQSVAWIGPFLEAKLLVGRNNVLEAAEYASNRISIPVPHPTQTVAGLLLRELPTPGILSAKDKRYRYFGDPVLGFAAQEDLRAREIVLVEGPIDVMRCKQAKIEHPIGLLGSSTALSQESLKDWIHGRTRITLFLDWAVKDRWATFKLGLALRCTAKREQQALQLDVVVPELDVPAEDPAGVPNDDMLRALSEQRMPFDQFLSRCIEESTDSNDPWQAAVIHRILANEA